MSFKLMAALPAKLLVGSLGILAMMVPAEAAAQSTSSVPGVGPHQAAAPIVFADPTAGECESQTLTSYVPPTSTLKGIFYFPWHEASGECTNSSTSYWCACVWRGKPGAPRAAAGLYDSATATVIDGHMQTIASKGLEVVGIEWTRQNNTLDQIALGQIPGDPKGVVGYAADHGLKVAVLYDLAIRFDGSENLLAFNSGFRDAVASDFAYLKANYFTKSNYLKIDNRPVVYLYITRAIKGFNGTPANQAQRDQELDNIQALMDAARAAVGSGGIYLVADHMYWGGADFEALKRMKADAITAFHGFDKEQVNTVQSFPGTDFANRPVTAWAKAANGLIYESIRTDFARHAGAPAIHPGVSPQYDDASTTNSDIPEAPGAAVCSYVKRPLSATQTYRLQDLEDWRNMLDLLGAGQRWAANQVRVRRNCSEETTKSSTDPSVVWVYSFNEWAEGSGIEPVEARTPAYPFGFGSDLIDYYGTYNFSAPPPVAAVPFAITPAGTLAGQRPNFSWDGVHGGIEYSLEVQDASGAIVFSRTTSDTMVTRVQGLDAGSTHSWRVRGRATSGWGQWSPWKEFTTAGDGVLETCNNNNSCEESLGEDSGNCGDCSTSQGACESLGPLPQSFSWSGPSTSPGAAVVGLPITLTANTAAMTPGLPVLWDMGNGDHRSGSPLSYSYSAAGTYNVTLTSNDLRCGFTQLTTVPLHVGYPPCLDQAHQAGYSEGACRTSNPDPSSSCFPGETPIGVDEAGGCSLNTTCCAAFAPPPPPPDTQSCGQLGGDYCSNTSSCPSSLYTSLGTTRQGGQVECLTCCNDIVGDGYCEPNVEGCGTSSDCPCWMAGTTCSTSGPSGECVDRCSDPAFHNHSGSCGQADECGHPIGTAQECLPSCGAMGGDYCSQTNDWCPGGHSYLGQSYDCASCCQADPCASPYTHDHGGSCGSTDSCGHSFGSNDECGCPGAPTEYDTCWDYVCDTEWSWVPEYCDTCEQQCTTEWSCWTNCEWDYCWDECVPYESCSNNCYSYECGGYWAPSDNNCRWEPYQCNPHQCGY